MKKKKKEEKKNETQTKNSKKNLKALKAYNQIKVTVQEKTCGMTL